MKVNFEQKKKKMQIGVKYSQKFYLQIYLHF